MKFKILLITCMVLLIAGCATNRQRTVSPLALSWQMHEGYAARASSYDRTGHNKDSIEILPDQTVTLADIKGPGIIRHIWTTTNASGPIGRTLVIRFYWDGSEKPSVEVPFGDFFGIGHGINANVNSWPITNESEGRSRNCWWPMPFESGARVTITNEGTNTHKAFYFHVDYLALKDKPETPMRFHAQYRQNCAMEASSNYTVLEAKGKGLYVGTIFNVDSTDSEWWGEGDEIIQVDNHPLIIGTGTEDYFCDAWGIHQHNTLFHGCPLTEGFSKPGQCSSLYRFHILDAIPFSEQFRFEFEHGARNERKDFFSSVAFWYQSGPKVIFPKLPGLPERLAKRDREKFIQKKAWQTAMGKKKIPQQQWNNFQKYAAEKSTKLLIKGLSIYQHTYDHPTEKDVKELHQIKDKLQEFVKKIPKKDRYLQPKIKLITDNHAGIPIQEIQCLQKIRKVLGDLQRQKALKNGLKPGDEFIFEVSNYYGKAMDTPTYEETADFHYSYAKVEHLDLMGTGSRFTYGTSSPSYARVTPEFPETGKYRIQVIFSYGANASDICYEIRSTKGLKTIPLEQRGRINTPGQNNGKWIDLGIYPFQKGRKFQIGSITLNSEKGNQCPNEEFQYRAYIDSIKFIYLGDQ